MQPCWRVCGKNLNIKSMCAVSPVVHISNTSSCQKRILFQFSCGCGQFHWVRSFGFLIINVCNRGDHYETPCICVLREAKGRRNQLFLKTSYNSEFKCVNVTSSKIRSSLKLLQKLQLRGGADKSLARPGRKQVTATKLRIYSTYSPRSSIHFLARCSNFCKSLKKKTFRKFSSNKVSAAAMTSASEWHKSGVALVQ